jgi:hypothetical protein
MLLLPLYVGFADDLLQAQVAVAQDCFIKLVAK